MPDTHDPFWSATVEVTIRQLSDCGTTLRIPVETLYQAFKKRLIEEVTADDGGIRHLPLVDADYCPSCGYRTHGEGCRRTDCPVVAQR